MKVLILSLATGEGHNSSARALAEECKRRGDDCVILDAYRSTNLFFYGIVRLAYALSSGALNEVYGFFYRYSERNIGNRFYAALARIHNGNLARKMKRILQKERPDAVIYTHVFGGQILEALRRRGELSVPAIGILTDLTLHPRWERIPNLGHLVLPHEDLVPVAVSRGYDPAKLHPLGIPIHPKYKARLTKAEARRKLGLSEEEPIVLIMGGSMGFGSGAKYVKEADKAAVPFRIVSISGRNQRQFKKISRMKTRHPLTAIGFSGEVELWMSAADLLISKPGGLSSAEAMSCSLPILITKPIPGHEVRNGEFLVAHKAALPLPRAKELAPLLDRLLENNGELDTLAANARSMGHPAAGEEILGLAHRLREQENPAFLPSDRAEK